MHSAWHDESSSRAIPPLPPPLAPPLPPARKGPYTDLWQSPTVRAAGIAALLLVGGVIGWTARGWNDRHMGVAPVALAEPATAQPKRISALVEKLPAKRQTSSSVATAPPSASLPTIPDSPAIEAVTIAAEAAIPATTPSPPPVAATQAVTQPAQAPVTSKLAAEPPTTTSLFQELDLQRMPKFAILGAVTVQDLQYKILSELKIAAVDDDGVRHVEQCVLETQLVKSDDLSRTMFEQSLQELKGWQFSFKLNPAGQVVAWNAGPADGKRTPGVEGKGGKGFLVTSVLDEDGWKELTQLSFFVPDEQAGRNQVWSRPMAHSFGALGSWYGQTDFRRKGTQDGLARYDYAHKMTYQPPEKDRGDLPFSVKSSRFQADIADGSIGYDPQSRRVRAARDRFLVRGEVTSDVVGQPVTVQVEEQQVIALRLTDENPWASK